MDINMKGNSAKHNQVQNIIQRSKALILNVKILGADTSHAKDLLDNAKSALDQGDYGNAIEYAKKSMVEVMQLKKQVAAGAAAEKPVMAISSKPVEVPQQTDGEIEKSIEMDTTDKETENIKDSSTGPNNKSPVAKPEDATEPELNDFESNHADIIEQLDTGFSYMIEENRADVCFEILSEMVISGHKGLCICRTNPAIIRRKYNLDEENSTVLWLTDRESSKEATISPSLESMIYVAEEFIDKNEKAAILLDGLEYLISNNSFNPVLRFIRRLIDKISETDSLLLIGVSPKAINEQELKLLERELNPIHI